MKKPLLLLSFLAIAGVVWGGVNGAYTQLQVLPVAELDGDTIQTYNVSLDSFTPKQIDTGNPTEILDGNTWEHEVIRKRTICNTSSFAVFIGSQAIANASWGTSAGNVGFVLWESTRSVNSCYTTWNTAPIYGACVASAASCTVSVLKEINATY